MLRDIYGLGLAEGAAIQNLIFKMPTTAVQALEQAVCKYGMVKGPITHSGSNKRVADSSST